MANDPDASHAEVLKRLLDKRTSKCGRRPQWGDHQQELEALNRAIEVLSHTAPDPAPSTHLRGMIKRLEWVEGAPSSYTEIAESPFGHYSVWEINGTACWSPWKAGSGSIVEGGIEGAKAAAQADFEDRILSALTTEGQNDG